MGVCIQTCNVFTSIIITVRGRYNCCEGVRGVLCEGVLCEGCAVRGVRVCCVRGVLCEGVRRVCCSKLLMRDINTICASSYHNYHILQLIDKKR